MHSMLQSDFRDVVSPTFCNISRLNDTARVFAVYAWQLGYPSPPKTRLAARWLGFGRTEFTSVGFQSQVSRRHQFLLFPFARLGLAQHESLSYHKKQQMRWTQRGAHLLLQTRVQVLNDNLRETFNRWYPGTKSEEYVQRKAAA
jgi:hypothetical protein